MSGKFGPRSVSISPFSICVARCDASRIAVQRIPSRYAFPLFLKYGTIYPGKSSQRLTETWSPGTQSTNVNGPLPSITFLP